MIKAKQFLLVEPTNKTPYPPLGLMKISSMLRNKYKDCSIFTAVGMEIPDYISKQAEIYITSLFTWESDVLLKTINYYKNRFYDHQINVGGIAATLLPDYISKMTGIIPHVGLYDEAENYSPDYSINFGRKLNSSITFTSRGCPNNCSFCSVKKHEPNFFIKEDWENDINEHFNKIVFWDNNWLASPNFYQDCQKLVSIGKLVDFNQGLDSRLFSEEKAKAMSSIRFETIRFAYDNINDEKHVLNAINLSKKYLNTDIRVYVLYNYKDSPEDFYFRINQLNKLGVLSFPMEYRNSVPERKKYPGPNWDVKMLRGLKLSLLFYYRRGMITSSRNSFESIYGKTSKEFISKLYKIFEYDKTIKIKRTA